MTDSDSSFENFLILKYGSLSKAYHIWINTEWGASSSTRMTAEEFDAINEFFAVRSYRDRYQTIRIAKP